MRLLLVYVATAKPLTIGIRSEKVNEPLKNMYMMITIDRQDRSIKSLSKPTLYPPSLDALPLI